ncbi:MAG TPA: phosphoglycerate kinase [Saprospiraceae bacterium]|nr:phosphoglycerate kinase [Saprospiraceae bacterium]
MQNWEVNGKTVLLRVDFNVPIKDGVIKDASRIEKSLDTIRFLLAKGAKLIVLSHLGRPLKELLPDGTIDYGKFSLAPVSEALRKSLGVNVIFAKDCAGSDTIEQLNQLKAGEILLCENTRFNKQEEKADPLWSKQLADLAEFYVNDAFGSAHREHASTATVARFFDRDHKAFGFLMKAEVDNGKKVLHDAQKPFTAILGGAKVSDKILLIENLMDRCDHILIGGGMAYTLLAAQGYRIGTSLLEKDKIDLAKELIEKAKSKGVQLVLPEDSVVAAQFSNDVPIRITQDQNIEDNEMGLDVGPKTVELFSQYILKSKTLIWNGPMGVFEMSNFASGTKAIAQAVADATSQGAYSLIGGGDSAAAINQFGLAAQVSFVSTGGGAMLELLEGKELPGVAAILD